MFSYFVNIAEEIDYKYHLTLSNINNKENYFYYDFIVWLLIFGHRRGKVSLYRDVRTTGQGPHIIGTVKGENILKKNNYYLISFILP